VSIPLRPGTRQYDAVGVVTGSRVGWARAGVSASVVGFWLVIGRVGDATGHGFSDFVSNAYPNIVFGLAFPTVGALILSRLPGHRLGRLYLLCGFAAAITLAAYSYAQRGLVEDPGSLPGALGAAWLSSWVWLTGVSPLLTFGVLWFPDGRLPSRRRWPVAALAGLFLIVSVVLTALRPGPLENQPVRDNPLGVPLPRGWFDAALMGVLPVFLAAMLGSVAALVVRYRRGTVDQRAQLRWFLLAVGLLFVSIALSQPSRVAVVGGVLALFAVPLLPLSLGTAVLRQRLYGIDVVVRRSLTYGWLIAGSLAVYAAVIVALDLLLRGHAEPVAALAAAGAVAVLYQPLRLRLQRAADRMLYGDRGDPYGVLTRLGRSLESAGSAEKVLPETVAAIASALRLPYVAVHLSGDASDSPAACYGDRPGERPLRIPLIRGDETVGVLVIGRRGAAEDLTSAERRPLEDLARQVAVASHAVLLDSALKRSRERLVTSREEERRRLRRELHDGLGPALAGIALGVDAARNLITTAPHAADSLLADLKQETLSSVREVRRIVEDLRPPALAELGLLAALTAFVERLDSRNDALRVTVQAPESLPPLAAAIEVAAYRIAVEAMTNVARHARAHTCLLRLDLGEALTVEVTDDGIGYRAGTLSGVGVPSMTERAAELGGQCHIAPSASGGTCVLARLPLAVA
jgi:two-component system NarL family sensor kinase